jgi:hypothetical protein
MKIGTTSSISRDFMETKMSLKYNDESQVLVVKYRDGVSVNEFLSSLKGVIHESRELGEMNGVVLDFLEASFDFPAPKHQRIVEFLRLNLGFFENYRVGVVANNPHNIVVAMLIARADFRYCFRPFTTLNAAVIWAERD